MVLGFPEAFVGVAKALHCTGEWHQPFFDYRQVLKDFETRKGTMTTKFAAFDRNPSKEDKGCRQVNCTQQMTKAQHATASLTGVINDST